jgi:hypothetical protein
MPRLSDAAELCLKHNALQSRWRDCLLVMWLSLVTYLQVARGGAAAQEYPSNTNVYAGHLDVVTCLQAARGAAAARICGGG